MLRRSLLLAVVVAVPRAAGRGAGEVNAEGGVALGAHDPVAYFSEARAVAGLAEFSALHESALHEQDAWAGAPEWGRGSDVLLTLAAGLGLTEQQVDGLFRAAAAIQS